MHVGMIGGMPVVVRDEWGAKKAKKTVKLKHPIKLICFCFTPGVAPCYDQEGCTETVRAMQESHMSMGLLDIHYKSIATNLISFIVGGDGLIYEGRGWFVQSSRSPESPKSHGKRLDIAYIGDEEVDRFHPPNKQVPPAKQLITYGVIYKFIIPGYDVREDKKPIQHKPSPADDIKYL